MKRWLIPAAALLTSALALPATASADVRIASRPKKEVPPRKGMVFGIGTSSGATAVQRGFVPRLGFRSEIGAGITDRFTLVADMSMTGYQGIRKGYGGAIDIVGTGYIAPKVGLRLGLGATSLAPGRADIVKRPGIGGIVGISYEFRPFENMGIALIADYDGRVRTDGLYAQAFVLSLRLRGYVRGKKR